MRGVLWGLISYLLLSSLGCGTVVQAVDAVSIVGTWTSNADGTGFQMKFNSDGTFESGLGGGTYTIDDASHLTLNTRNLFGGTTKSTYTYELKGDYLIFHSSFLGFATANEYYRKK
jgi:hypothetical protein